MEFTVRVNGNHSNYGVCMVATRGDVREETIVFFFVPLMNSSVSYLPLT
jgi:hypothetical protein